MARLLISSLSPSPFALFVCWSASAVEANSGVAKDWRECGIKTRDMERRQALHNVRSTAVRSVRYRHGSFSGLHVEYRRVL